MKKILIIIGIILIIVVLCIIYFVLQNKKNKIQVGSDPGEIIPSKIPHNMLVEKIEAYAMPSSAYVPDDNHVFVVTADKKICWNNYGRCWESKGERVKIAENNAYIEWLEEFAPHDDIDKGGIRFGINGVCQTISNRELLIGENEVDVRKAEKYYVPVAIFGKYGFGLNQLKELIKESFYNVKKEKLAFADDEVLDKVLKRVDNYLDDELIAWEDLAKDFFAMPIEDIKENLTAEDKKYIRDELQDLVNEREKVYQKLLDGKINEGEFKISIRVLLDSKITKQLDYLETKSYISQEDKKKYMKNVQNFLHIIQYSLDEQQSSISNKGVMEEYLQFR